MKSANHDIVMSTTSVTIYDNLLLDHYSKQLQKNNVLDGPQSLHLTVSFIEDLSPGL
jgi:hypothetical protein